jgi:hypothetical protein
MSLPSPITTRFYATAWPRSMLARQYLKAIWVTCEALKLPRSGTYCRELGRAVTRAI